MKTQLEMACNKIDSVLQQHGHDAKVAGGYVAGNGILFSLTDTTFADTQTRMDVQSALRVAQVFATVGVILVNGYGRQPQIDDGNDMVIEGEIVPFLPPPPLPILPIPETVSLCDLIEIHKEEEWEKIPLHLRRDYAYIFQNRPGV